MDFFSMMFTADAAAKHGHEFSPQTIAADGGNRDGSVVHRAGGLPNMPNHHHMRLPRPLSVLPRARPQHTLSRTRHRPHSMKITMAELKEDPEGEQADEEEELRKIDAKIRSFAIPGAFQETPPSSRTSADGLDATAAAVRPEPQNQNVESEDLGIPVARETSDETGTSTGEGTDTSQLRKNANRSKVFYRLGRPHAEKKTYLRPKCLLQVQETGHRFHRPVYDVVPGSRFNPRTKIGQKLRRLRRNKDGTGADDLVVVRSEHRHESKEDGSEEEYEKEVDHEHETLNGQEVLGAIQPAEDGPSAYITLGETVWKATLDGSGSVYTLENAHNPTERARWYVPKAKRAASLNGSPREFNFTVLQPGIKRHPVVAKMSEGHLEFYEESVSTVSPGTIIPTDEAMRRLIVVSGLWVYFCEGWSKHYDFHSAVATSSRPVPGRSLSTRSTNRGIRDILRSPSRSPAPSLCRAGTSASSDTRSREGSHDSTATATSLAATMVRHSTQRHASDCQTNTPIDSRASSPEVQMRGRRRWSASFTNHFRRFSHSMKHPSSTAKEDTKHQTTPVPQIPPMSETIITADLVDVEELAGKVDVEQHPLQTAFIKPMKTPTTILVSSSETVVDHEDEVFVPALDPVEQHTHGFAVYSSSPPDTTPSPQSEDAMLPTIPTIQSTPKRPPHVVTTAPTPPHLDGPSDLPPHSSSPLRPHRFGLGDLARPKIVFTPQHQRTESSSSSDLDGEEGHGVGRGWWHQYDRMVLREGSGVVPTS